MYDPLLGVVRPGAVTVLWGAPGNWQAPVSEEIAFRAVRAHWCVLALADGPGDQLRHRMETWRARKGLGSRNSSHLKTIDERKFDRERHLVGAITERLHSLNFSPGLIVFTSPCLDPQGINGAIGHRVLEAARAFAANRIAVLVAGHVGPVPGATCNVQDAALWRCAAALNLTVTLTGPEGREIVLRGTEIGSGALTFDELAPVH